MSFWEMVLAVVVALIIMQMAGPITALLLKPFEMCFQASPVLGWLMLLLVGSAIGFVIVS